MSKYKSGKLPIPFTIIPQLEQWEEVLKITKPENWTPQGMFAATKVFASNFDNNGAIRFYKNYLLAAARNDIKKNKKLNYHYY